MKLTDFCMLSAALFVCLFLGRDLYIRGLLAEAVSEVAYNRQMDRISEDALMDVAVTEYGDGSLDVQAEKAKEQFAHLLALSFDLTDEASGLSAEEAMTFLSLRQYPYRMNAQELNEVIAGMEQQINGAKRRRRETKLLRIVLPSVAREPWYQMPAGPQLLTVFDPREPSGSYERAVISGSRIVKRGQERD